MYQQVRRVSANLMLAIMLLVAIQPQMAVWLAAWQTSHALQHNQVQTLAHDACNSSSTSKPVGTATCSTVHYLLFGLLDYNFNIPTLSFAFMVFILLICSLAPVFRLYRPPRLLL